MFLKLIPINSKSRETNNFVMGILMFIYIYIYMGSDWLDGGEREL